MGVVWCDAKVSSTRNQQPDKLYGPDLSGFFDWNCALRDLQYLCWLLHLGEDVMFPGSRGMLPPRAAPSLCLLFEH